MVTIARIYEPARPGSGRRVLVDRLWPRGLSKAKANIDAWEKAVAPSNELRKWYGHVPERWPEFETRYREELKQPERAAALDRLRALAAGGPLVLLTATRDFERSEAAVLKKVLDGTA